MSESKIQQMHREYGAKNNEACRNCRNLETHIYGGNVYRKCAAYGVSSSVATDWRLGYVACGLFNKTFGVPLRDKQKSGQLDGQTSLL
jgi:hypothetical protein